MEPSSAASAPVRALGALLGTIILLIVELVLTMLVYTGLNIYSFDFFGRMVRQAGSLLEFMAALVERVFAGSTNAAYASLFGELGPKSILLLLIGLAVAAVVRLLGKLIGAMRRE